MGGDVWVKVDEGFRVMYERDFPTVYRAVRLLCGDSALAEDAAQEAFARALARWSASLRSRGRLDGSLPQR